MGGVQIIWAWAGTFQLTASGRTSCQPSLPAPLPEGEGESSPTCCSTVSATGCPGASGEAAEGLIRRAFDGASTTSTLAGAGRSTGIEPLMSNGVAGLRPVRIGGWNRTAWGFST